MPIIPFLSTTREQQQAAALPVRRIAGVVEVGLVTTRRTGRWIVPKGWVKAGDTAAEVALAEAREEAGWLGTIGSEPIGSYSYWKRIAPLARIPCRVTVFLLEVERELDGWPEAGQRRRQWVSPDAAARRVSDAGLANLIRKLAATGLTASR